MVEFELEDLVEHIRRNRDTVWVQNLCYRETKEEMDELPGVRFQKVLNGRLTNAALGMGGRGKNKGLCRFLVRE